MFDNYTWALLLAVLVHLVLDEVLELAEPFERVGVLDFSVVKLIYDITVVDLQRDLGTCLVGDKLRIEVLLLVRVELDAILQLLESVRIRAEDLGKPLQEHD